MNILFISLLASLTALPVRFWYVHADFNLINKCYFNESNKAERNSWKKKTPTMRDVLYNPLWSTFDNKPVRNPVKAYLEIIFEMYFISQR